jgi:hypothetical protein
LLSFAPTLPSLPALSSPTHARLTLNVTLDAAPSTLANAPVTSLPSPVTVDVASVTLSPMTTLPRLPASPAVSPALLKLEVLLLLSLKLEVLPLLSLKLLTTLLPLPLMPPLPLLPLLPVPVPNLSPVTAPATVPAPPAAAMPRLANALPVP